MAITVKKIVLWRTDVENKPGALAAALEAPAKTGADLRVVMGYRHPGEEGRATIEVYPIAGRKETSAAKAGGLSASQIPTLLIEGDNKAGLGHAIAQSLAAAGINVAFLLAQVIGRKFSAVAGFETEDDAKKAAALVKKASVPRRR